MKGFIIKVSACCLAAVLVLTAGFYWLNGGFGSVFGQEKNLPIYWVDTKEKKVAISFDCACAD